MALTGRVAVRTLAMAAPNVLLPVPWGSVAIVRLLGRGVLDAAQAFEKVNDTNAKTINKFPPRIVIFFLLNMTLSSSFFVWLSYVIFLMVKTISQAFAFRLLEKCTIPTPKSKKAPIRFVLKNGAIMRIPLKKNTRISIQFSLIRK